MVVDAQNYRVKYGNRWLEDRTDVSIELECYRRPEQVYPELTDNWKALEKKKLFHFNNAFDLLWVKPKLKGKYRYVRSYWTDRRIEGWCISEFKKDDCNYQAWWGPSSAGKTTDAALIVLTHWLADPENTACSVCSTTIRSLEKRIWGEIKRYYNYYGDSLPGAIYTGERSILFDRASPRGGIFAIAIQAGKVEDAVGDISGVHAEYNVLVIDECQSTRWAAVEAWDNLETGREAKFLGMGNPVMWLDPLGRISTPKAGKGSINPLMESWETERGKVLFFDGRKSPGVADPKTYWFLLNQRQIDNMKKTPGENSPRFWSQRIGYIAPEGLVSTVMTPAYEIQYRVCDNAIWEYSWIRVVGFDPAWTNGGDSPILYPAKIGMSLSGIMQIEFEEPITINLEMSHDKTMLSHLVDKVLFHLHDLEVPITRLSMDCTGAQSFLADGIEEKEKKKGILRCGFGNRASSLQVSVVDPTPSNEKYRNLSTEAWSTASLFAQYGQIRGLGEEAFQQFCSRIMESAVDPVILESKKDFKSRCGMDSPDEADAAALVCLWAKYEYNMFPGGNISEVDDGPTDDELDAIEANSDEDGYLTDPFDAV